MYAIMLTASRVGSHTFRVLNIKHTFHSQHVPGFYALHVHQGKEKKCQD